MFIGTWHTRYVISLQTTKGIIMIKERDLVVPAVSVIRAHGGVCDTSDLINGIKSVVKLSDSDVALLPSGFSKKIEQIVRNLKCNDVLTKTGLAEHYEGGFMLTEKGLSVSDAELTYIAYQHVAKPAGISPQGALTRYLSMRGITFVNTMKAVTAIKAGFYSLAPFDSTRIQMKEVGGMVREYIAANPENVG